MADNSWGVHYPELPDAPNIPSDFKQAVDDLSHTPPKFGSAGARGSALTGLNAPVEGDLTYLSDVDRYERYNGSVWVPSDANVIGQQGGLAGSVLLPSVGASALIQTFAGTVVLNAFGEVVVPFPQSFPNSLMAVSITNADFNQRPGGYFAVVAGGNTTTGQVQIKGYNQSGVLPAGNARVTIIAIGR